MNNAVKPRALLQYAREKWSVNSNNLKLGFMIWILPGLELLLWNLSSPVWVKAPRGVSEVGTGWDWLNSNFHREFHLSHVVRELLYLRFCFNRFWIEGFNRQGGVILQLSSVLSVIAVSFLHAVKWTNSSRRGRCDWNLFFRYSFLMLNSCYNIQFLSLGPLRSFIALITV